MRALAGWTLLAEHANGIETLWRLHEAGDSPWIALRRTIAVALGLAFFIAALALAGYIAERVPTILALAGVLVLVAMVLPRKEGRR